MKLSRSTKARVVHGLGGKMSKEVETLRSEAERKRDVGGGQRTVALEAIASAGEVL